MYLFNLKQLTVLSTQAESSEKMKYHLNENAQIHFFLQKKHSDNLEMKIAELAQANTKHEQKIKHLSRQQSQERKKMESHFDTVEATQKDFTVKLKSIEATS